MHAPLAWVYEIVTAPLPAKTQLPVMERDGKTVRIDSNRDYQLLYASYLSRGLLPVRCEGHRRGRRTIRFRICGLELNLSLKARVRSVENGVTMFAIEIDRHQRLFASLARDMPVLV